MLQCNSIIFPKKTEISLQDIITVKLKFINNESLSMSTIVKKIGRNKEIDEFINGVPSIISGHKTIYFFEAANDAEKEWITLYLDDLIHARK